MELQHSFSVPVEVEEAFSMLQDIERIAPCMPGATVDAVDGDTFSGKVKVKVGPIQVTYAGEARFVDVDPQAHRAVLEARGKEMRGAGTAQATITAVCVERDRRTDVTVTTDLAITGRPAQFGRGVMADVGDKLLGQFADCLANELGREEEAPVGAGAAETATGGPATPGPPAPATGNGGGRIERPRPTPDAIDLVEVAGASIARRAAPVLVALALAALIVWIIRR